ESFPSPVRNFAENSTNPSNRLQEQTLPFIGRLHVGQWEHLPTLRGETVMRTLVFLSLVVCALIIGSVSWTTTAAMRGQKQRAVAKFDSPVTLQGAVLKGTYLFVHDD